MAKQKPKSKVKTGRAAEASAPPIAPERRGPSVREVDLKDLGEDPKNANAGTERGHSLLEKSISRLGAGRSLVTDRNGFVVAGNKTREALIAAGITKAVVIETDGTTPVVVQRRDFDLADKTNRAREYAFADNRVGEIDLAWDARVIASEIDAGVDLSTYFSERELEQIVEAERAGGFDPTKEWDGMPEFDQDDKTAVRRIVVNFKSNADAIAFGKLLGQPITDKTRSMWHPAVPIDRLMDKRYGADDSGDEPSDEPEDTGE